MNVKQRQTYARQPVQVSDGSDGLDTCPKVQIHVGKLVKVVG